MFSLAGYAIGEQLHGGQQSEVYRAIALDSHRAVLLKVSSSRDRSSAERCVRREFELGAAIDDANVVRHVGVELTGDRPVLVLEDFGARTLADLLASGPMEIAAALRIARGVARGLARLHHRGLVHRAIHPGEVLVDPSTLEAKVAGLGSVVAIGDERELDSLERLPLPLEYASPEQTGRTSRGVDHRTDFYSLGATLYHAIAGHPPFEESDPLALVHAHLAREPVALHETRSGVPRVVSKLVAKLLEKNPERRYQDALGIDADLSECIAKLESTGEIPDFAIGKRDVPTRPERARHLFGRDRERTRILDAIDEACSGAKIVLLVSGYSGIGKSALVLDAARSIDERNGFFITGKFDQQQRMVPYAALGEALHQLCERILTEPDARLAEFRARILDALGAQAQLVVELVPSLARILGAQPPVPPTGLAEGENRFHRVVQRFLGAFTGAEHPIVLFLDDLQWADAATLRVLEALLRSDDSTHLVVVGAYRHEDVGPEHPVAKTEESLRRAGIDVRNVPLGALDADDVAALLANALRATRAEVSTLANAIVERTSGNPFFVEEFLDTLMREKVLCFDLASGAWTWDSPGIERLGVAPNVADLVARRLVRLPESAREALRVAAMMGHRFALSTLARVLSRSEAELRTDLELSIGERVLVPLDFDKRDQVAETEGVYRFVHDRVQQSAIELTPAPARPALQLSIGRALLDTTPAVERDARLFEIVDLLDAGRALIDEPGERLTIARLNLEAGKAARATSAHGIAYAYYRIGISLLPPHAWEANYELARDLHIGAFESSFASGDTEDADALFDAARPRLRTALERADLLAIRLGLETTRGQYERSLALGLEALAELGEHVSEVPSVAELLAMPIEIGLRLRGRSAAELAKLPAATDPAVRAKLDIIANLIAPSYLKSPKLFLRLVFTSVILSLSHGNAASSSVAYMSYAMLLAWFFKRFEQAEEFGRLGLALAERPEGLVYRAQLRLMFGMFIHPYRGPLRESVEHLRATRRVGLESGNIVYAGYAGPDTAALCLMAGSRLEDVAREAEVAERVFRLHKNTDLELMLHVLVQYTRCLRGETLSATSLSSTEGQEEALIAVARSSQAQFIFGVYVLWKISLLVRAGESKQALDLILEHDAAVETGIGGNIRITEYAFVACLVLADAKTLGFGPRVRIERMLWAKRRRLETWAAAAPWNFRHKALLVTAGLADAEGRREDAEANYDEAIRDAREHGFVQHEALAAERAARCFFRRGSRRLGRSYLTEARAAYGRWGATAKEASLGRELGEVVHPSESRLPADLDLTSIMRSVRAISSEMEVRELLERTMTVVVQNAGAERGALLVETDGHLEVVATFDPARGATQEQSVGRVERFGSVPESLVRYVFRTGEDVVLAHAAREGRFMRDSYIDSRGTKSVLSIPVRHQDRILGVLYLENDLATGAFPEERVEVLRLLVAQAAIALENSRLYEATRKLNVALKANETRLSALLDGLPVGVFVVAPDRMPVYANHKAMEITGTPFDSTIPLERLAQYYRAYWAGTDDVVPWESTSLAKALRGESSRSDDIEFHVGDKRVPIAVWGSPVRDQDGAIEFALVAFQDISDQRAAEAARASLEEQLHHAQRLESLGRLAGGIAHDFNNLLTPMLVYSDLAQRSKSADEKVKEQIGFVRSAAERAASLTKQLLAFGRREVLETKNIDLNSVLEEFGAMFRRLVREDIAIELRLAPSIGPVRADPAQVHRVVMNLSLNAVDAMPEGGKLVLATDEVELEADPDRERKPGTFVRLRVIDTGAGMDAETLRRIFDPFFTTKGPGKGTGLGLPTVHGLMKQHGGELRVESSPGRGSTFELLFPRAEHERSIDVDGGGLETPTVPAPSATVLVVEYEAVVRTLLAEVLAGEGYEVIATGDSAEALRIAGELGPKLDLLVTDVVMPKMTGRELLRRLRAEREGLKALFVSGHSDEALVTAGVADSEVRLLQKPFTVDVLRREVREVLRG